MRRISQCQLPLWQLHNPELFQLHCTMRSARGGPSQGGTPWPSGFTPCGKLQVPPNPEGPQDSHTALAPLSSPHPALHRPSQAAHSRHHRELRSPNSWCTAFHPPGSLLRRPKSSSCARSWMACNDGRTLRCATTSTPAAPWMLWATSSRPSTCTWPRRTAPQVGPAPQQSLPRV